MSIVINGNKNLKFIKAVYYQPVIPLTYDNYLTIEALEDGLTVKLSTNSCQYSNDVLHGLTWLLEQRHQLLIQEKSFISKQQD